jgi:HEAT repeat protein
MDSDAYDEAGRAANVSPASPRRGEGKEAGQPSPPSSRKPRKGRQAMRWAIACALLALMGWLLLRSPLAREAGVRLLGKIGVRALPLIRRATTDSDLNVRRAAADVLVSLGPAAVPPLIASLRDADPQVRVQSATALGILGEQAKEATSPLLEAISDPEPSVRQVAVFAFRATLPDPDIAVPALINRLRNDEDKGVRIAAAACLSKFGPRAREAIPALEEAAEDSDPILRDVAEEVLERIAPPPNGGS